MPPLDFYNQYDIAKEQAIRSIRSNQNIALYGPDASGKTYLMKELIHEGYLNGDNYVRLFEGDDISSIPYSKRYWLECNNHDPSSELKNDGIVIYMNVFQHPDYVKKVHV
jgi:GTPase SAR1 family protein